MSLLLRCEQVNTQTTETEMDIVKKFSEIHKYHLCHEDCFRIFGPPKDLDIPEPDDDCEIVIYNIPTDEKEDILLALLLKFNRLYYIKFVINNCGNHRGLAFAKFTSHFEAERAIHILNTTTIYLHQTLHMKLCSNCDTKLYIGNINVNRYPLYRVEQIILNLVCGLESYIVFSLNKYNRYIIMLEFFSVQDLLLSIHDICKYELFARAPDIFICTAPPFSRLRDTVPICNYIYKTPSEFKKGRPGEIRISHKKYNELKMF